MIGYRLAKGLRYVLIVGLSLMMFSTVRAQGGLLTYGQSATSSLSAQAPISFFTFQGTANDLVTVQVIALSPNLDLAVSLLNPSTQVAANSSTDPYSPVTSDARLSHRLQASGVYTLLVSSSNGASGDFLLRLVGDTSPSQPLVEDAPTTTALSPALTSQTYTYTTVNDPVVVNVTSTPPNTNVSIEVRSQSGSLLAIFENLPVMVTLPPNGTYEITARYAGDGVPVTVVFTVVQSALAQDAQSPVTTPEIEPPATTPEVSSGDNQCLISSASIVNMRSGPGTNYAVVGQLPSGITVPADGVNNGWYHILVDETQRWVSASVVNASAACQALPFMQYQPSSNVQPSATFTVVTDVGQSSATPTPSYTATTAGVATQANPTSTPTPSYTATTAGAATLPNATNTPTNAPPPAQPTATFTQPALPTATFTPSYTPTTPPAPQQAPSDARFNSPLTLQLDSTGSVTEFVSYPGGDVEDRVRYSVSGMNANSSLSGGRARLILAVSCFGNGTEHVTFFTNGQTYTCGQTIVDREVTFDSNSGSVVITAAGGSGTYVQWVLTGTATRVN